MVTKNVMIAHAPAKWRPYRGTFAADGTYHIAVTMPGGFTGWGSTSDDAIGMAKARFLSHRKRVLGLGLADDVWWAGVNVRVPPFLDALIKASVAKSKPMGVSDSMKFSAVPTPDFSATLCSS